MGRTAVNVAVIDIGTNSMRLLMMAEDGTEIHRQVEVTGLGVGVDATGRFDDDRVSETLAVLADFGATIRSIGAESVAAVATSGTRDASNGPQFVTSAAQHLGVVPEVISGAREAALAFQGATAGRESAEYLVVDIGGGSTEFVRGTIGNEIAEPDIALSVDIGSVRLTDRCFDRRPVLDFEMETATSMVADLFRDVPKANGAHLLGVAGTFTSVAAMALQLKVYDRDAVEGAVLELSTIDDVVAQLRSMSIEETALIPSLHPRRARVILAGSLIAAQALRSVAADQITVRESDLLDGLAQELIAGLTKDLQQT
jgi:exopolyphosphatase/guanosine-5'-triphosphate,3'-diphosphate pyrophosphatase